MFENLYRKLETQLAKVNNNEESATLPGTREMVESLRAPYAFNPNREAQSGAL